MICDWENRYEGDIAYRFGVLRIGACKGLATARKRTRRLSSCSAATEWRGRRFQWFLYELLVSRERTLA